MVLSYSLHKTVSMARHIELNPVSHLTIGTVGVPGKRIFYLQGSKGNHTISLIIEKHQAAMLATSFESLLEEIHRQSPPGNAGHEAIKTDLRLREPVEALFRVGNIGLGYNSEINRVVIIAYELVNEDEEPNIVSYWATQHQIESLIEHTREIVKSGRPICGNCGGPIDVEGHFCPKRNGLRF